VRPDPTQPDLKTPASAAAEGLVDALHRGLLDGVGEPGPPGDQRARLRSLARDRDPLLPGAMVDAVVERVRARVDGLGPLEPLLADPTVDEVMLNGGGEVWVERHGRLECTPLQVDERTALALIERIVAPLGLHVDRSSPLVDARLPDGSRVNAVVRPLAVDGPCLTIRRFGARRIGLAEVAPPGTAALLAWAVGARANVVVCGGAGAGKTTLLNALAAEIPDVDRVVTIEDAAELRLPGRHVVRLEARPASAEGNGEVRIRDLVRNALRMRPDRIVVGEVRAGEALDMLQAMNTGHEGSLSTCHANSPGDALRRLETLVLMGDVALPLAAVREQVRSAIDLVVQISRRPDGGRRVTAVAEVSPYGEAGDPLLTTALTDADGRLAALPLRPARSSAASRPNRAWIEAVP
jgi:pilus assembly protein CpaF